MAGEGAPSSDSGDDGDHTDDTSQRGVSDVPAADAVEGHVEAAAGVVPSATVDSRWWYWIAAVPVFFLVATVVVVVVVVATLAGLLLDAGAGSTLPLTLVGLLVLVGMIVVVLFPIAIYVDAQAVVAADVDWNPDPILYSLVALVGTLTTVFVVSVPLSVYYLYRRHRAVGVP